MNFIYLHVVVVILIYLKETVGLADKNKNAHLVGKERRCDPTFAYQQVMYDVSREILHYTSRWVYIMLTLVILFTNHNDTCNLISVGICFGVCKRFQAYMVSKSRHFQLTQVQTRLDTIDERLCVGNTRWESCEGNETLFVSPPPHLLVIIGYIIIL